MNADGSVGPLTAAARRRAGITGFVGGTRLAKDTRREV